MAGFCQNCGAAVESEAGICPSCGFKSDNTSKPADQASTYPRQKVHVPEQFEARNAARRQRTEGKPDNNNGRSFFTFSMIILVLIIVLIAVGIGLVVYFGFRDGGFFRWDKNSVQPAVQSFFSNLY